MYSSGNSSVLAIVVTFDTFVGLELFWYFAVCVSNYSVLN